MTDNNEIDRDFNQAMRYTCEEYTRGELVLPPHQRDYVWNRAREISWAERMSSDVLPVGVIVTYKTAEDNYKNIWVNDGSQRIRCSIRIMEEPRRFGLEPTQAYDLLHSFKINMQHRIYPSHSMAYQDFVGLNIGVNLTAFELFKGVISYMPGYEESYRSTLEIVHDSTRAARLVLSKGTKNRRKQKTLARRDYLLFYQYIRDDPPGISQTALGTANSISTYESDSIEWLLRNRIEQIRTHGQVRKQAESFSRVIENEAALIKQEWDEVKRQQDLGPHIVLTEAMLYYLFELAIWRRRANVLTKHWRSFIRRLLKTTRGTASLPNPKDSTERRSLAGGRLDYLPLICKWLDYDIITKSKRKPQNRTQVPNGFDVSHVEPVSTHGEGPTIIEPASLNRSRKDKPIGEGEQ